MNKFVCGIALTYLLSGNSSFALFRKVPNIDSSRVVNAKISENNPEFVAVASDRAVFISKNGGSSFSKITGLTDQKIANLFIDDSSKRLYLTSDRNAYKINAENLRTSIFSATNEQYIYHIAKNETDFLSRPVKGYISRMNRC